MNISFCHKTVAHNLIQFGTIHNAVASLRRKTFQRSQLWEKNKTTQVIRTVGNLTLHSLHKHIFLISHLLVVGILKAEYKSKQQSAMLYSMDGK